MRDFCVPSSLFIFMPAFFQLSHDPLSFSKVSFAVFTGTNQLMTTAGLWTWSFPKGAGSKWTFHATYKVTSVPLVCCLAWSQERWYTKKRQNRLVMIQGLLRSGHQWWSLLWHVHLMCSLKRILFPRPIHSCFLPPKWGQYSGNQKSTQDLNSKNTAETIIISIKNSIWGLPWWSIG